LHRYYEVYFGILEVQGGDLELTETERQEFPKWIATLFEHWNKAHQNCKDFERELAESDPWL